MSKHLGKICIVIFFSLSLLLFSLLSNFGSKTVQSIETYPPTPKPFSEEQTSPTPPVVEIKIPIVTYHYVRVVPNPEEDKLGVSLSVTPVVLRQELSYLKENGYTPITFDQLDLALKGETILPPKSVVLTFDDGYEDFYTQGLPIIKEFKVPVTLFMPAGFVGKNGYLNSGQLQEIDETGLVKIGVHSFSHANLTSSYANLNKEVYLAKKTLEDLLGHELSLFAYPYGTYNEKAIASVKGAGFKLAASTDEGLEQSEVVRFNLKRNRPGSNLYQLRIALGEIKVEPKSATRSAQPNASSSQEVPLIQP